MIDWVVSQVRSGFCKHDIITIKSTLPTERYKKNKGYHLRVWKEYVTLIICKKCMKVKIVKEH